MSKMVSEEQLGLMLDFAVPIEAALLNEQGGPTFEQLKQMQGEAYKNEFATASQQILFGGKDRAKMCRILAQGIALLSFCPDGIQIFGRQFKSDGGFRD